MEGRIAALQRRIPEQADALLLLGSVNRYYYTAFSSGAGYLFVAKEKAVLLVDGRYIEAARRSARDCEVERITDLPAQIDALCGECGVRRLGIDTDSWSVAEFQRLQEALSVTLLATPETSRAVRLTI